jgi:lysozyme
MVANLVEQLKRDEGLRLKAYLDTVEVLTIGYGHNCISSPVPGIAKPGDAITMQQAEDLLRSDTDIAIRAAVAAFPWVQELSDSRQAVVYNMAFNLGIPRLKGFKRFLQAAKSGDYVTAAREMLDSAWSRQVGKRATRLARQMETGQWAA